MFLLDQIQKIKFANKQNLINSFIYVFYQKQSTMSAYFYSFSKWKLFDKIKFMDYVNYNSSEENTVNIITRKWFSKSQYYLKIKIKFTNNNKNNGQIVDQRQYPSKTIFEIYLNFHQHWRESSKNYFLHIYIFGRNVEIIFRI